MLAADVFSTPDIWLSAFLKVRGMRLIGTERTGNRVFFAFEEKDTCERLAIEYLNGGKADVSALRSSWQDLKRLIFQ